MKKYLSVLALITAAAAVMATGCSGGAEEIGKTIVEESQTTAEESRTTEAESETETAPEEVAVIAASLDKTSADYDEEKAAGITKTESVLVKNNTGMDITDLSYSVQLTNEAVTLDDLIPGYVLEDAVTAEFVYPAAYDNNGEEEEPVSISMTVTFNSEKEAELHEFMIEEGAEDISLCYEEEVLFLTYKDKDGNEVSTKEAELAFGEEETTEKETEEAAVEVDEAEQGGDSVSYDNGNSAAPANDGGDDQSVDTPVEEPVVNDGGSADDGGAAAADPDAGCLGDDALFN